MYILETTAFTYNFHTSQNILHISYVIILYHGKKSSFIETIITFITNFRFVFSTSCAPPKG